MKDSEFKNIQHCVESAVIITRGSEVSKGYKPDLTVRAASDGKLLFILESEQKTDRKAFLGALMKAEMFAEVEDASPELIIVMQIMGNTTVINIAKHIQPYVWWLSKIKGGNLHLSAVHVMSDTDYLESIACAEALGSEAFKLRGCLIEVNPDFAPEANIA